jgi:hypothetical protein
MVVMNLSNFETHNLKKLRNFEIPILEYLDFFAISMEPPPSITNYIIGKKMVILSKFNV